MVVDRFFAAERDALAALEQSIIEAETAIDEAIETAQALLENEPEDEEETATAATVRVLLKDTIGGEKTEENRLLREALKTLQSAEAALKLHRAEQSRLRRELQLKVELKLYGVTDSLEETRDLLTQTENELTAAGGPVTGSPPRAAGAAPATAEEKVQLKKRKDLAADTVTLREKIDDINALLPTMAGQITEEESRELILQKHHDLVASQVQRYVQTEERALFHIFENLFAKYYVSAQTLESECKTTMGRLDNVLSVLGYT